MCGIAGWWNLDEKPIKKSVFLNMTNILKHRGPDAMGVYFEKNLGLGHRRLSVIDLSELGNQPMKDKSGRYWIIYNGEIYNFPTLKKQLGNLGYRFKSRTDTEVVLYSFIAWGTECFKKFNGIFALAIWDKKDKTLVIARDRFGAKPMYYYYDNKKILFGSEIKAIIENPLYKTEVNLNSLRAYFTFQNVFNNETLFKNILIVSPAQFLIITKNGVKFYNYWEPKFKPLNIRNLENKLLSKFKKSVKQQLISDVDLGAYLSGGLDSGSIVAIASRHIKPLTTFCGGFDTSLARGIEANFDESRDAQRIADYFKTHHITMTLRENDLARVMPKLIWHLEDLRAGMCYQNFYISNLASSFTKVVLSGAGGDELFGGYPWRYRFLKEIRTYEEFKNKYFQYWQRLVDEKTAPLFFSQSILKKSQNFNAREHFDLIFREFEKIHHPKSNLDYYINAAFYFDIKTFLHGLLVVEDKINSAHSLEVRVPFLDNNLADLAFQIFPKLKVDIFEKRENFSGKIVLKKALSKILPHEVIEKPKQGFSPPDGSWWSGPGFKYIESIIGSKRALERGYFNPGMIKKILYEHKNGFRKKRLLLWSLLSFEWWNRIFIDKEKI